MTLDIGDILNSWPYRPGEVNVRRIMGADGRDKFQMRLDLGILQMETSGRPDGTRPHGFESLLEYHEDRFRKHCLEHHEDTFSLDGSECNLLRMEGIMYYHRYLAAFVLADYTTVCEDTHRNLRLFDFLLQHADREEDRLGCEQYRPYVMMMYARARSSLDLQEDDPSHALAVLNQTIEQICEYYRKYDREELIDSSSELATLRSLCRDVRQIIPLDSNDRLRKQLEKAVEEERYEDAAILRDRLGRLGDLRFPEK